jgi:hypothetical protein
MSAGRGTSPFAVAAAMQSGTLKKASISPWSYQTDMTHLKVWRLSALKTLFLDQLSPLAAMSAARGISSFAVGSATHYQAP